jgi:hypothetical protein
MKARWLIGIAVLAAGIFLSVPLKAATQFQVPAAINLAAQTTKVAGVAGKVTSFNIRSSTDYRCEVDVEVFSSSDTSDTSLDTSPTSPRKIYASVEPSTPNADLMCEGLRNAMQARLSIFMSFKDRPIVMFGVDYYLVAGVTIYPRVQSSFPVESDEGFASMPSGPCAPSMCPCTCGTPSTPGDVGIPVPSSPAAPVEGPDQPTGTGGHK